MYRRIELIDQEHQWKTGLCGFVPKEVADAWFDKLKGPDTSIPRNAKFYFTELGWDKVGREVVAACQRIDWDYRVISVKENSVNVVWHDEYEVAAQPRKKFRRG